MMMKPYGRYTFTDNAVNAVYYNLNGPIIDLTKHECELIETALTLGEEVLAQHAQLLSRRGNEMLDIVALETRRSADDMRALLLKIQAAR